MIISNGKKLNGLGANNAAPSVLYPTSSGVLAVASASFESLAFLPNLAAFPGQLPSPSTFWLTAIPAHAADARL